MTNSKPDRAWYISAVSLRDPSGAADTGFLTGSAVNAFAMCQDAAGKKGATCASPLPVTTCPENILSKTCDLIVWFSPRQIGLTEEVLAVTFVEYPQQGGSVTRTTISVPVLGGAADGCPAPAHTWLPLMGAPAPVVQCWFDDASGSSPIALATQMSFLYSASASTLTVGANLVSLRFAPGFDLTLSGKVNAVGCPDASNCPAGSSTAKPTAQQESVEQLLHGGNLVIRGQWPLLQKGLGPAQVLAIFAPSLGANVSGSGARSNVTAGIVQLPVEVYSDVFSLNNTGDIFCDFSFGREIAPEAIATQAGIGNHTFWLRMFGAGVDFGSVRFSAQYSWGPNASGSQPKPFNQLILSLQASPGKLLSSH